MTVVPASEVFRNLATSMIRNGALRENLDRLLNEAQAEVDHENSVNLEASLRPRPGESAQDTLDRVLAAIRKNPRETA